MACREKLASFIVDFTPFWHLLTHHFSPTSYCLDSRSFHFKKLLLQGHFCLELWVSCDLPDKIPISMFYVLQWNQNQLVLLCSWTAHFCPCDIPPIIDSLNKFPFWNLSRLKISAPENVHVNLQWTFIYIIPSFPITRICKILIRYIPLTLSYS